MNLFKYGLINETVKHNGLFLALKRFNSKQGSKFRRQGPCERALQHFDDFYKSVFNEKWPSVRLGLLSKQRYMAVVNNFGEVEKTEKLLQNHGALNLKSFLEVQKSCNLQLEDDSPKMKKKLTDLQDVVLQQLEEEEEKEMQLHPEGLEFKAKADSVAEKEEEEEEEEEDEFVYTPESATTSLEFDMKRSEIDTTRLILPNSPDKDAKLQEYVPVTKLRGADYYVSESEYYKYYKVKSKTPFEIEEEHELEFPENLKVYTFDRGDFSDFPELVRNAANIFNFLKVDGAELLAALFLGVEKNDRVLDLCSSSENIAYCIFQTLRTKFLLCANNDGRMDDLFKDHLIDFSNSWGDILHFSSRNISEIENSSLFDKVLVDVRCTSDRASIFEENNNIFHVLEIKKRLKLPEFQTDCLVRGLKLVRPGGTVVYTTSTLSPVQNEAVVNEALHTLWSETKTECTIKNLTPALQHTTTFFNYGTYLNLKYGTLVVPFVPVNFGPRYICKIVKKVQQGEEQEEKLESPSM